MRDASKLCVIVDAELDDIAGLNATRILRDLCPQAKIIFTSPQNTRDLEAQVRSIDVFYYYISSGDWAELVAAVKGAIGEPNPPRTRPEPKVLIVDDDSDFQDAIRVLMESAGYSILSAYSAREGLEMARRQRPDAILLDIIMDSTTDGFEFCREARRDPLIKHTPIVGVSAVEARMGPHSSPDHDQELFPVDGYLRKPVEVRELVAELKRLIPGEE
jgi:CheY-like chemotaxis protein